MSSIDAPAKNAEARSKLAGALYFRLAGPALVFAPPEVAEENDRIYRAITESKTWGEFRRRMPPKEYAELTADSFSSDPDEIVENPDAAAPADEEPFSSECVPAFCDGDYPRWIAGEQQRYVSMEILRTFGTREHTFLNGSCWRIYESRREEVLAALRAEGHELIERNDLEFY